MVEKSAKEMIAEQSKELLKGKNDIEMLNVIYDTLFQNKQFPQFNLDNVDFQQIDNATGIITFDYNGHKYDLIIR